MATLHALKQQISTASILKEVVEIHRSISSLRHAVLKKRAAQEQEAMHAMNSMLGAVYRHYGWQQPDAAAAPTVLIAIASNRGFCADYNVKVRRLFEDARRKCSESLKTITIGDDLENCKAKEHIPAPETSFSKEGGGQDTRHVLVKKCLSYILPDDSTRIAEPPASVRVVHYPSIIEEPKPGNGQGASQTTSLFSREVDVPFWMPAYQGLPHGSWRGLMDEAGARLSTTDDDLSALFPQLWIPRDASASAAGEGVFIRNMLRAYAVRRLSFLLFVSELEENEKRMQATNSIADNIEQEIRKLQNEVNKTRQAMITRELTELISGAKAFQKLRLR